MRTTRKQRSKIVENCAAYSDQACERKRALKRNPTPAEKLFLSQLREMRLGPQFQKIVFTENRYFILDFVIRGMQKNPIGAS